MITHPNLLQLYRWHRQNSPMPKHKFVSAIGQAAYALSKARYDFYRNVSR